MMLEDFKTVNFKIIYLTYKYVHIGLIKKLIKKLYSKITHGINNVCNLFNLLVNKP